jgi:hypothetical protein
MQGIFTALCITLFGATAQAQTANGQDHNANNGAAQSALLWQKLENYIQRVNQELDGTMGARFC